MPTTPIKKLSIVAKVRSTRKAKRMDTRFTGKMGVKGISGVHYYEITVVGGQSVPERMACSCPAHRFGRAKIVQQTGMCKHMHKVIQELAANPDVSRTENGDVIVYSPQTIRALATR